MKTTSESPVAPPGLEALVTEDDNTVVVSFALDAQTAAGRLSAAESEVVALLFAGRSNREIAAVRGTKPRTTANQVASLFRKLGVRSRLELVTRAAILHASRSVPPKEGT